MISTKKGTSKTVIKPVRAIAVLENAPSISPISSALDVPTAWEEVPIPMPMAMAFKCGSSLTNIGEITAPIIPVIITIMTVMEAFPPSILASEIAMGVVIDFGNKE